MPAEKESPGSYSALTPPELIFYLLEKRTRD
jgi:hypothetical protein